MSMKGRDIRLIDVHEETNLSDAYRTYHDPIIVMPIDLPRECLVSISDAVMWIKMQDLAAALDSCIYRHGRAESIKNHMEDYLRMVEVVQSKLFGKRLHINFNQFYARWYKAMIKSSVRAVQETALELFGSQDRAVAVSRIPKMEAVQTA